VGVIKIIEYQNANRAGVPPRGIGAGGVLLIIFLVFMGLTARETTHVNWQEFRDHMHIEGDVPWWGTPTTTPIMCSRHFQPAIACASTTNAAPSM